MSDIPEIRIYYSYLLADFESKIIAEKYDLKMDSEEQFIAWAGNYRAEWSKYESKIITALQKALGVGFYKPVIDVNCAPFFRPKSDPLIMNFKNFPDKFVDELTHELCHVLLTDNTKNQDHSYKKRANLLDIWKRLFGQHDTGVLVHIPVQALMKHIYIDVLKEPSRLDRDKKDSESFGDAYVGSWEYVEEQGYKEIIAKLKKSYAELPA
jgi:hypothetical protein